MEGVIQIYKAICKNEEERFSLVRVKYDGNMPKIIEEVYFTLVAPPKGDEYPLKQLDYGAAGISLTKQEVVDSLQFLIDNDKLPKWQITHCKKMVETFTRHEDEMFMYVEYEI